MKTLSILATVMFACVWTSASAQEHDYYQGLRYPSKVVPGVGADDVEQEGGADAVGYRRRTVKWWPRKQQDVVDIPEGAPLRTWTRNKGQEDKEALAGICRSWTASDAETFKAHLVGFRSFGTSSIDPSPKINQPLIPIAVLRMENGEIRGVHNARFHSMMISYEDTEFIQKKWEEEFPKLYAKVSHEPAAGRAEEHIPLKLWTAERVKFNAIAPGPDAKFPQWGREGSTLIFNTPHFHFIAKPTIWGGHWGQPGNWVSPGNEKHQNLYRKNILEFAENMWTYFEAAGACMPFWRVPGPNYKFIVQVRGGGSAGGWMHCGIGDANIAALGHEFGFPCGNWGGYFIFTQGNATQHAAVPGELQVFSGNFCYPWRNVNRAGYQSSLWMFVLGDNPNWGFAAPVIIGGFGSRDEWTAYHTVARLGQEKGLWENGIRGFGDFFGEYAARMVTVDICEQNILRSKYGMPEVSYVSPVYGKENRYRISNAEAPRWCGFNIIRLNVDEGAEEIAVDLHGIHDPELHSDWRACIVAVDGNGRARYSPMWNKGKMTLQLKPSDKRMWLTVSASPSAFPVAGANPPEMPWHLLGTNAPRYPWEATFTGCTPGTPHRLQGDVGNFDELYCINNQNKYLDYPTKCDVPIPLDDKDGKLAQEKLAEMLPRIKASVAAVEEKIASGHYGEKGWWTQRKMQVLDDLETRAKYLQRNAKGHRHLNGGGFVSENSKVAETAYVGANAMVLDGARVEGNASIKEFAVVTGPKVVVSENAKIGGRAWVAGDIKVGGNARILEGATVVATRRTRGGVLEGSAVINGNAVIKGDPFLYLASADDQTITGSVVVDYGATVNNRAGGVFDRGRFYREIARVDKAPGFAGGADNKAMYANWQFNQPKAVLLEDAYVNNNGILYGQPGFADDGEHHYIEFNGKDQYAEAPASVADFGELTIDMLVKRTGNAVGRLFDFGTGEDECFYLTVDGGSGKPTLTARHGGKTLTLAASQGIPSGKWSRVRVEMDGSTASIHIDGKQVAKKAFAFSPRSVFISDRPEGNFIACGRGQDEFFKGQIDHFRVYRAVHEDFASIGPAPFPITQVQEWSPRDQELSDEWEAGRRVVEAKLGEGKYGELQKEIGRLHQERGKLHHIVNPADLEARVRKADETRNKLEGSIHQQYRDLPVVAETEKQIGELGKTIDTIAAKVREDAAYVKLSAEIQAAESKRGEVLAEVRESLKLKAIAAEIEKANKAKVKVEESIRELPELKELAASAEQETDGQKKRELQEKYNRLLASRQKSDTRWHKAEIAIRQLNSKRDETLRVETETHAGRIKLEGRIHKLNQQRGELHAKLLNSNQEYAKLQKLRAEKQAALQAKRQEIEQRVRSSAEYKTAVAESTAARKAIEENRKKALETRRPQIEQLGGQIGTLSRQAAALREEALTAARVAGQNPYPGTAAARMHQAQKNLDYRTSPDWENRTPPEVDGKAPPKMIKWLKEVRGW